MTCVTPCDLVRLARCAPARLPTWGAVVRAIFEMYTLFVQSWKVALVAHVRAGILGAAQPNERFS